MVGRGLNILISIIVAVLFYFLVVWVLNDVLRLGVPEHILKIVVVLFGLVAVAGAWTGRYDSWWGPPRA